MPELRGNTPELWAGVECTVNRIGDVYFDQLERNGHAHRPDDLDRFAELGVQTLRYPILWERTAPDTPDRFDWSWADERLGRLRELGITPIVGLVHHGSGPRYTDLLDPAFPDGLARFAAAVAERFPWVEKYTPVNEPLTTARFSGLYGHWYPHGRDKRTCARALLTQCRAVVLAMRAVRAVNPSAWLVQTEDLGRTFSTPLLAYQAEFENERRWLTWDLLCGRVAPDHPLWGFLRGCSVSVAELEFFLEKPCPPELIGINHYITSERFLDERLDRYPPHTHGGNGRHRYADVEAVRACAGGPAGLGALLREAWGRYGRPLAVTEVHLGCTREGQLRWMDEAWRTARALRDDGVDVRAVTVWSLLGSYDWNSLLTRADGFYEPGVFDLRAPEPRPTALARMVRDLAAGKRYDFPVLDTPGWWHRADRMTYSPVEPSAAGPTPRRADPRPVLIAGATGTLGGEFGRICDARGIAQRLLTRAEMDIADPASVRAALAAHRPWAVINAAGYVRVDDAEREPELCLRENTDGPATLAAACAQRGIPLLTFSSDLVFDGSRATPYVESDPVAPLNVYGQSKAEAEARVLGTLTSALVVRTSAFFGPRDLHNFVTVALRTLLAGDPFVAASDAIVSPTYVPDLVHACLDLLIDGESGIWHLANPGATSWGELARTAAIMAGLDPERVEECTTAALNLAAPRPLFSALGSARGSLLPPLEDALARYFHEGGLDLARGAAEVATIG